MTDWLTPADPEPPRRSFVEDPSGFRWWRTDSDGIDNTSANWCSVEHGCASGSGFHDHESWTKVAGNYGPVRIVEGTVSDFYGFLEQHGLTHLRDLIKRQGVTATMEMIAAMVDDWPTPEDLAERARRIGTDGGSEQDVLGLIRDAEAGGEEHMAAVASQVACWPTGPSKAPFPGVYDPRTGRPAWHESNILLSVSVRIDGRLFTAREMLDPMLFDLRFGDTEDERFEDFVRYFLRSSFGGIATADDESYRYLRRKVWIVKPGDLHDLQRCARSYPDANGQSTKDYLTVADREGMWPRCSAGFILRSAEAVKPNPIGWGQVLSRIDVLGVCPCRCHRADPYGASAKRTAERHGIPDFDEQQLDEVEDD